MFNIQDVVASIRNNVEGRIAYEVSKGANSAAEKVARYCASDFQYDRDPATRDMIACNFTHSDATHELFAQGMIACEVDSFDFANSQVRKTNRFNVYALEKVMMMLRALHARNFALLDSYSQVILLNTLHARVNDSRYTFTRNELYVMMTRDSRAKEKRFNVKVKDLESRLNVGFSTATTQVSSSLRALSALKVMSIDDKAHAIRSINFDHVAYTLLDK